MMRRLTVTAALCLLAAPAFAGPVTDPHGFAPPAEEMAVTPSALPGATPAFRLPSDRWYLELGLFADAKAARARWQDVRAKAPSLRKGLCCTLFRQGGGVIAYIGPFASFYDADQTCALVKGTLACRLLKGEAPPSAFRP
ncbi:MAG: SPOR domain-containing protein [Alphaproteobacteria bacterium]|nr:SPOR domain-containing protein [Alphaproteobacteria bacterium]